MKTVKELLRGKREGAVWTTEEIEFFVSGVVDGSVSSAQTAAFLMAACINGLKAPEISALTTAMALSGKSLGKGLTPRKAIDKHSTGGVGDKISLVLAPLAVACGLAVPMISGRGLGHTGGTVDKLESVTGLNMMLTTTQMENHLREHFFFMAGQSKDIAPADRVLYGLRDVTGTVENVGLIASSILSKKFAEGLDGLVMDMKVGEAAFMQSFDHARQLAEEMLRICKAAQLPITFVFSRMDNVIGNSVGNWVELQEAEEALQGRGWPDVVEITEHLAVEMLLLGSEGMSERTALQRVRDVWQSGEPLSIYHNMITRQGGDWQQTVKEFASVSRMELRGLGGIVPHINGRELAILLLNNGGGRRTETDTVDRFAGVRFEKRPGEKIALDETMAHIYAGNQDNCTAIYDGLKTLVEKGKAPVTPEPSHIIDVWRWG